jgi:hypothetical protein
MNLHERQSHFDIAIEGLTKLFPEGLAGNAFLDIGCGSGLHSNEPRDARV